MAGGVEFQQGYWSPISHKAIDILSKCDGSVIKVYHVLLKMASREDRNCWPSVATIAEEGNVSTRCVTRAISTLEENGLIKVRRRYSDNQGTLTNMYLITSDIKKEGEEFQDAPGCNACHLPLTQDVKGDDAGVLPGMTQESYKQESIEQDSIRQQETRAVKQKKEKKGWTPPTLEEIEEYLKDKGYDTIDSKKAFAYFNACEGVDGKGNPILNWKLKMVNLHTSFGYWQRAITNPHDVMGDLR